MKLLLDILFKVPVLEIKGEQNLSVSGITQDSRQVEMDGLFVAVRGFMADGHDYISKAIDKGAIAVVCEEFPETENNGVTFIKVADASEALGLISCNYFDHPSSELRLVGVTGTNGKTTVATLLYSLFRKMGLSAGLLSTVKIKINDREIPATHTTPDAVNLNRMLREMVDQGCEFCFMECSSHAIHQNRIAGLKFEGAIFTNLSHDHLDYHGTFANYIKAKKKFFDDLHEDAFALVNNDDKNGKVMVQNTKATKYTYSLKSFSDFKAKIIENDFNGMLLSFDGDEAWFELVGKFNAYNLLAVYSAAFIMGMDKREIITALTTMKSVSGRFEYIVSREKKIGIVDYAHTPDALQNVLSTINEIRSGNEKVITIIGCGGDRDTAKRPLMAQVACELSDKVILTSDNPRTENPDSIIDDMLKGISGSHYKKTLRVTDRKEAIKTAVSLCSKGDIILLAGKGHETYQEINGVKLPFDDKQTLREVFELMESDN